MRSELLKLLWLPTPRWMLVSATALAFLLCVGVAIDAPPKPSDYSDAALLAALVSAIQSIVLGVWMVGLEYGQGTMRRVVAATPARISQLTSKLIVMLVCVVLGTVVLLLMYWALVATTATLANGVSIPADELPVEIGAALVFNVGGAVLGFTMALLTRSMAGGIAATFIVTLVVDSALGAIPYVGDYTFGKNITDVESLVRGDDVELWVRALALTIGWLVALSAVSWARFVRQDVK
jgi:ABC-type transport system involved in multi-copper enzyme maturation permease subunit